MVFRERLLLGIVAKICATDRQPRSQYLAAEEINVFIRFSSSASATKTKDNDETGKMAEIDREKEKKPQPQR
jgi:hypothetical protein